MVLSGSQGVLSGSQWLSRDLLGFKGFSVLFKGYQRFSVVLKFSQWFSVFLKGSQMCLKIL